MITRVLLWPFLAAVLMLAANAFPATALETTLSYSQSDLGLNNKHNGMAVGLGTVLVQGNNRVDLTLALEYVLRAGGQPRYFSNPRVGLVLGEAKVTLHYLQPALFVGRTFSLSGPSLRVYTGLSLALKLSENWTQPAGDTNGEFGFEDTDFMGHVGVSFQLNSSFLDARYSYGFLGQLIDGTVPSGKSAEDPVPGIDTPEDGARISGFQVGLGAKF